ncbi:phosphoglycerate mutase-like protein [Sistotremastrum suecicum HHB10207 ss-3]|uniref:Phosphoglycerate mutase-like protein n=1 Tax=Sistotremastrum suecicum HHB10207 ss-3 TaxID=1314776 RepID=A0A165YBN3_9AGAM|nr:phosphoglycerate mutase-like protein [Sistotremastrum suecicum HHB10207 ss-3]
MNLLNSLLPLSLKVESCLNLLLRVYHFFNVLSTTQVNHVFSPSQDVHSSEFRGIYNTSHTPSYLPWDTYNYCNAPHVNEAHYSRPPSTNATLIHVTLMMRHHKRTPDNLYPNENALNPAEGWDCSSFIQENHGNPSSSARVYHNAFIPSWHPFKGRLWNGNCSAGQLTKEGLDDAVQHGKDLISVYRDFLAGEGGAGVTPENIHIRTSNEDRTYQVAGALLYGMDTSTKDILWPVYVQPSNIDSLVPSYSCPAASALRAASQSTPEWKTHLLQNQDLMDRLGEMLGTKGLGAWEEWFGRADDHFFDTFASRTCHSHPLPCNPNTKQCVSEEDARRVFALGDWEYNWIWNEAPNAKLYTQLTFGVMVLELATNLRALISPHDEARDLAHHEDSHPSKVPKMRIYVGHDGSLIRLASGLGIGKQDHNGRLRWPALGSEIILEVWSTPGSLSSSALVENKGDDVLTGEGNELLVRVLHEGSPVRGLEWVPFNEMLGLLESNVPPDLYDRCQSQA